MMRLSGKQTVVLFGVALLFLAGAAFAFLGQPRILAQRENPDGSSMIVLGKPRIFGMMGIEIVLEERAADGSLTSASVQDLFGSWKEAIVKYEPDGGGLLVPEE